MKAKVRFVALYRAEGPIGECVSVVFYVGSKPEIIGYNGHFDGSSFVESNSASIADDVLSKLRCWGETAPERGYDKVDFLVMWENGLEYEGRFDMKKGGSDSGEYFWQSLKGRLDFFSCRVRPAHFKDDSNWKHHCASMLANGGKDYCEKILAECVI